MSSVRRPKVATIYSETPEINTFSATIPQCLKALHAMKLNAPAQECHYANTITGGAKLEIC